MTTSTPYCNDYWYHGYQGLGITYTNSATRWNGFFVIGGSVTSGCNLLKPSTYQNDQCAIVETFDSFQTGTPSGSYLLNWLPHASGANLGVVGISSIAVD